MNQQQPSKVRHFWQDFAVISAILVLTAMLYAPSLAYPFVWHEADDLSRSLRYTPIQFITGMPSYEYYRPAMFLFWRSILDAWKGDAAPIFHAYSIGMHLLNAVLLYALVRALTQKRAVAAAAALVFTTYPFSYQAITWSTAHFHPMVLLFVLCFLLSYVRTRLIQARGAKLRFILAGHMIALTCLLIGILVHETAFVGPFILLFIEAYLWVNRHVPRRSLWPLVYIALALLMYGLYVIAAKSPPLEKTFEYNSALYLLQGLVYPVAMLMANVCQAPSCDSAMALPFAVVLTLLILLWIWRSGRTLSLGLLGIVWFILGVAPAWAGRDYVYVSYAPRLLYFAGAGVSLGLAAIVGVQEAKARSFRILVVACIVLQGGLFVLSRQPLYAEAFRLAAQENAAMFAPRDGKALFVNTVDLFSCKRQEFPLGWFGVPVAPWHNRLGVTSHLRPEPDADWVIDPVHGQQLQDHAQLGLALHGNMLAPDQLQGVISSSRDVYRVEIINNDLQLVQLALVNPDRDATTYIAEWSESLRLLSASIGWEVTVPVLSMDWAILAPVDRSQTVFVHVRNALGDVVAQANGDPVGGLVPFGALPAGHAVRERRLLTLPSGLPAGHFTVAVGVYNRTTLQRDTPVLSTKAQIDNDAIVVGQFDLP